MTKNLAIYIHWPFCKSKCPYCDFNSHVSENINHKDWQTSYIREIDNFVDYIKQHNISSIFFGGGTPTLMEPETAEIIINHLQKLTRFTNNIEITLEGNPTSVEAAKLKSFHSAGINRVSLGVQSLNKQDLEFLGREHSASEAQKAIELAASIFGNYSFDLIYARPQQSLKDWEMELKTALKMAGSHLSLYQLTIEKGTRFFSDYTKGKFQMPDSDLAADFYLLTRDIMESHGMPAYEISNHAKPGYESRHNLSYWHYDDYLGIGPGAHGRITQNGRKTGMMMTSMPESWLSLVAKQGHGTQNEIPLSDEEIIDEIIMMGLRIREGINRERFKKITGKDILGTLPQAKIQKLQKAGLIELNEHSLRCTQDGMLLVNSIAAELLT